MIVLATSIVVTGLPTIHAELGFTDTGLSWVSSACTLTFGGFHLLGARAGDIRTRAISFHAAVGGVSASIGPVLGGLLADWLSWRVGFFINVIGLGQGQSPRTAHIAVLVAFLTAPRDKPAGSAAPCALEETR